MFTSWVIVVVYFILKVYCQDMEYALVGWLKQSQLYLKAATLNVKPSHWLVYPHTLKSLLWILHLCTTHLLHFNVLQEGRFFSYFLFYCSSWIKITLRLILVLLRKFSIFLLTGTELCVLCQTGFGTGSPSVQWFVGAAWNRVSAPWACWLTRTDGSSLKSLFFPSPFVFQCSALISYQSHT